MARLLGEPPKMPTKNARIREQRRMIAGARLGQGGAMPAAAINEPMIETYVSARKAQGYRPATINRDLAMLRRAMILAHRSRDEHGQPLVVTVPVIELLVEDNVREGFPEEGEFQAIRAHLPPILQGLADFYRLTGYRKREPLRITMDMVDQVAGVIRLSPKLAKSRQWRAAWFYRKHPRLAAAVQRQLELREQIQAERGIVIPTLFFWMDGRPIKSFRRAWKKAAAAAGYPNRLVHDFRRMAARDLRRSGVDPKTARRLIGAKTGSIFDRYDITTEEDEAQAVEALAQYHEATSGGVPKVVPLKSGSGEKG